MVGQYRKIYEKHHGPIPVDSTGRKYDVHHKDGNHKNNSPSNLIALSIEEHYDIHHKQGDWRACLTIALRQKKEPSLLSELATKANLKRAKEGNHPFLGGELQKKLNKKRVEDGSHNFLGRAMVDEQYRKGTHPFLKKENLSKGGQIGGPKQTKIQYYCDVCKRSGYGNRFKGSHFEKCVSGVGDPHGGLKNHRT